MSKYVLYQELAIYQPWSQVDMDEPKLDEPFIFNC